MSQVVVIGREFALFQENEMNMKATISALVLAVAATFATANAGQPDKTVYQWLFESENHSTFVELINMSDMKDTWNREDGVFTIFAPTNDAFRRMPSEKLEAIKSDPVKLNQFLKYHMVGAKYGSRDLRTRTSLSMSRRPDGRAAMVSLKTDGAWLMINDARVTGADHWASNGVVHNIDHVLMPAGW
jgi:uncharacterized surface protein with fasciclin (FAS1) repeats